MDRKQYQNKINEYFKNAGMQYRYKKNEKDIYPKLISCGSLEQARKNAKKIHAMHLLDSPSNSESCTTVYNFFEEIDDRLKELE